MGQVIHARRVDGEIRYRMWSTVVGDYVSYEEDEDGIRRFARDEAVSSALDNHEITWPDRLKRAKETGSSSRIGRDISDLDSGWEKPLSEEDGE